MDLQLKDKYILVSGGSSGIGEAICAALAAEGAFPISVDRNRGTYYTIVTDLSLPGMAEYVVQNCLKTFGRIDGLVNNAGTNDGVGLEHGDYERFISSVLSNAAHYELLTRACLGPLTETKGAVVNIISKVAFTGQGGTSGYAAANGMRVGLTEYFAEQLAPAGIRVNGIVVAECNTPQYQRWLHDKPAAALNKITAVIPLEHRLTSPKEIADTAVFLLSPLQPASGQLLFIDGGYVHLDRKAGAG